MRFVGEKRAVKIFFPIVFLLSHYISYIDVPSLKSASAMWPEFIVPLLLVANYFICLLHAFNHSNDKSLSLRLVFLYLIIPWLFFFL